MVYHVLPCLHICRAGKQEQRYIDGVWQTMQQADHLKLTQHDAQVRNQFLSNCNAYVGNMPSRLCRLCPCMQAWLAVSNLVMESSCRSRTLACAHQCEALLQLRRLLVDPLLDQLPLLAGLRRLLEELTLGLASCFPSAAMPAQLIIEQVTCK